MLRICPTVHTQNVNFLKSELEFIRKKSDLTLSEIKFKGNQFPHRYEKTIAHSSELREDFNDLAELVTDNKANELKVKLKSIRKMLGKSKLYQGSAIFETIERRFSELNNGEIEKPNELMWNLINLEFELQSYLYQHLNDGCISLSSVKPLVVNDTLIYLTSDDSTSYQRVFIWDINKPDTMFYDESKLTELKLKDGIGFIDSETLKGFPNGFQGILKVGTNRGDIQYYPFENK